MSTQEETKMKNEEKKPLPRSLHVRWTEGMGAQIDVNDSVVAALGEGLQSVLRACLERAVGERISTQAPRLPDEEEVPPLLLKMQELAALEQALHESQDGPMSRPIEEQAARLRAEIEPVLRQQEADQLDRSLYQRAHHLLLDELTELELRRLQAANAAEQTRLAAKCERKRALLLDLMAQRRDLAGGGRLGTQFR